VSDCLEAVVPLRGLEPLNPPDKGTEMTTKKRCLSLADKHNIEINISQSWVYSVSVDIPEGYQFALDDNRQGLTFQAENRKQVWEGVYHDLKEIISYKPWYKMSTSKEIEVAS